VAAGTLDPLPRKMIWKSREVESVLGEVQEVIPTNPSVSVHANPFTWIRLYFQWRGVQVIDKDGRLKDVLPPALYGRWKPSPGAMTQATTGSSVSSRSSRPATVSPGPGFGTPGCGDQAEATVLKLARSHKVPIRQSKVKIEYPRDLVTQLGQIPHDAQVACLEAVVERLETGMGRCRRRPALGHSAMSRHCASSWFRKPSMCVPPRCPLRPQRGNSSTI